MTQTFERRLRGIKEAVTDASQSVVERTTETAAAANDYLRRHPWSVIAISAAAGALIGFLAAKR